MKATEDFLDVTLIAHVITASKELQSVSTETLSYRDLAKQIVSKFVTISIPNINDNNMDDSNVTPVSGETPTTGDASATDEESATEEVAATNEESATEEVAATNEESAADEESPTEGESFNDSVYAYAVDLLGLGLFWHAFRDSVREGDGDRIVRYWKFMAAIFRHEKHYNYSNEVFNLVAQTLLLSPRQLSELKWSRTINTSGRVGKNIPVDLHMEHLNRQLKIMTRNLGSNVSPHTTQRAAKALAVTDVIRMQFLKATDMSDNKQHHTIPSISKDLLIMQQQLTAERVFKLLECRNHSVHIYKDHKPLFTSINWNGINKWIRERIVNYN